MKACISRGIGFYTVFPSQGLAIFWLTIQKIVEATLWARMKEEGRGHSTTFEIMTEPKGIT